MRLGVFFIHLGLYDELGFYFLMTASVLIPIQEFIVYLLFIREIGMKKLKTALLIVIGCTMFSCHSRFELKSDKHLNEIFLENELQEIQKMITYVDNMLIESTANKDINKAYHQMLDKIDQTMQDSSMFFVPFEEKEKYSFLERLDTTVFNEFWYMGNHVRKTIYKDSIYKDLKGYKFLNLKRSGKYSYYLEKVGESDAYYRMLKESLEAAGGLTPSIVASFLKMHNKLDFRIPKNRLWVALFMLSIEEPHDKKMERYLNQK